MSETKLSREIKQALDKSGVWVIRLQSGRIKAGRGWMHLCPKGTPDLLCLAPFAFLEVKRPGHENHDDGKGTLQAQQAFRDRADRLGIPVAVVTSTEQALAFVRGVERR
jgi:hypothetical protein